MANDLEEILESDYKFVLIMGDYFDCPTCNPFTSFSAYTHYDEKSLLEEMLKFAGHARMEFIYVLDSDTGELQKYCDIDTKVGGHRVINMQFKLPKHGNIIIHQQDGKWVVADETYTVLYGRNNQV